MRLYVEYQIMEERQEVLLLFLRPIITDEMQ